MELPDTSVEAFGVFVEWVYTQKISIEHSLDNPFTLRSHPRDFSITKRANARAAQTLLVDLWLFADKYAIPTLQNATVEKLGSLCGRYKEGPPPTWVCNKAYKKTPSGSPIRRLVFDSIMNSLNLGHFDARKFCKEILEDIVIALQTRMGEHEPKFLPDDLDFSIPFEAEAYEVSEDV